MEKEQNHEKGPRCPWVRNQTGHINKHKLRRTFLFMQTSRSVHFPFVGLLALIALMSGCSSIPEDNSALRQQAAGFSPPPGMAGVYLINRAMAIGRSGDADAFLDYKDVGTLHRHTYFYCVVPPGRHFFCGSIINVNYRKDSFTAEAGKNYFFIALGRDHMHGPNPLKELSEADGQIYVRKYEMEGGNHFDAEPGESTVLLRLNIPRPSIRNYVLVTRQVEVLNLDTKRVTLWPVDADGWAIGYATPGEYLITRSADSMMLSGGITGALYYGSRSIYTDIRWRMSVPKSGVAIYCGLITATSSGTEINRDIDPTVREFYENSVPLKRSVLIQGDLRPDSPEKGNL
jgi:hypothetical protein